MPTSYNVLKDIKISVEVVPSSDRASWFRSTIRAKVHCIRELTGATIATIDVHAFAHSDSREEAIISVINEILEGNYSFKETVHHDAHYAELDYSKVHAMESHDLEDFYELFHKHFDLLKFSLPEALQPKDSTEPASQAAGERVEDSKS